jgi:hypothetical protein
VSIYASYFSVDDHEHTNGCAVYELLCEDTGQGWPAGAARLDFNGTYYRRVDKPCTCGKPAPIIYKGSHVNPADDDPRGGSIDLAAIPNFLHPNVRQARYENPDADDDMRFPVEFLRLSVSEDPATHHYGQEGYATVVLDRTQVERMRDALTHWLDTKERW